jgi:excinuclease ABC subunit C
MGRASAHTDQAMDVTRRGFDVDGFLYSLVNKPGVYRMLDQRGQVLYVGKARSLKKRLASYFRRRDALDGKTRALMSHTSSVEVTVTHTETEALLLENNLIKEYRPRYNILLRDDKSYPYIYVSTGQCFPRLAFHRGPRREDGRYFGPYASAGATRETLSQLQKLFQIRQCDDTFFRNRSRPCLQYQIKRCTAPCVGYVEAGCYQEDVRHALMFLEGKSEQVIAELVARMESASEALDFELAARYRDQIASLRRVQERQYVSGARGDIDVVAAHAREGEGVVQVFFIRDGQNLGQKTILPQQTAGAGTADILAAFLPQYYLVASPERPIPGEILVSEPPADVPLLEKVLGERAGRRVSIVHNVRGERARWLDMARANAELALVQRLADRTSLRQRFDALQEVLELDEPTSRIECFDVSHTRGEAPVASCVVFGPEGPLKSDYRRFNIRDVAPGDDYGAMHQALRRRYTRVKKEEGKLPDVLLVDGGKGQLARALDVLHELQVTGLLVVGVAKGVTRKPGLESRFLPGREGPLVLAPDSPALHLIQHIRDEAHRFAVTGHRTRRTRTRRISTLESIPGIGARRRQRLLSEFGGLQGVARAGVEDLARVQGISRELAQAIYESFREGA